MRVDRFQACASWSRSHGIFQCEDRRLAAEKDKKKVGNIFGGIYILTHNPSERESERERERERSPRKTTIDHD